MKRYKTYPLELIKVSEAISENPLCKPEAVYSYMKEEACADREIFWILHLNTKNKVVKKEITAIGCVDSCRITPGIVLRGAVASGAPSIVTVHNHPSGETDPSVQDRELWSKMREVCQLLGINLVDNLIIGSKGYYSEEENK